MRVTIVPSDKTVIVDNVAKTDLIWEGTPDDVHALQWYDVYGDLELQNPTRSERIETLPQWALNAVAAWQAPVPVPPVPIPTVGENKKTATTKLQATDWTVIPDVGDPTKSNPYLSNVQEFVTYRNAVRQYAINPVAGNITWPTIPVESWQTV
jgi:hypothetical protein